MLHTKICRICLEEKPLDCFYTHTGSKGYQSYCIVCTKDYYKQNKERFQKSIRENHLKRTYDLSSKEFNDLKDKQNGCCAICKRDDRLLCVDHNHDTGKIRGLLCRQCNSGLGYFKDNKITIEKAIEYLRSY